MLFTYLVLLVLGILNSSSYQKSSHPCWKLVMNNSISKITCRLDGWKSQSLIRKSVIRELSEKVENTIQKRFKSQPEKVHQKKMKFSFKKRRGDRSDCFANNNETEATNQVSMNSFWMLNQHRLNLSFCMFCWNEKYSRSWFGLLHRSR